MNVFRKNRTQSYSQASPSSSSSPSDQPTTRVSSIIPLEPSAFANTAPPAADSRPVASRSTSEAVPATQSRDVTGLPSYAPRPAALAVPSYYDAQMQSPVEGAVRRASFLSPGDGQRLVRDYFASPPPIRQDGGVEEGEEEDGDDPLVPRALRPLPQPSLLPLRRATLPVLFRHEPPPPLEAPNGSEASLQLPIELPPPPANALPAYNAHLAHDELRLISSVHLDQNHPAAAFFSAMTSSVNRADQPENQGLQAEEMSTGGKKLRLTITRGGQRMNDNGTGPIFIRLGRGGVVEGRIDVGKVDHVIGLEASVSVISVGLLELD